MNDFLYKSVDQRLGIINSAQRRLMADVEECQQLGDTVGAGEIIQQISNLDAEKRNLQQTKNEYVAALPKQAKPDDWRNKRTEEMTHYDVFNMINDTSPRIKLTPDDYNAGWQKLQEEKRKGNYTGKP